MKLGNRERHHCQERPPDVIAGVIATPDTGACLAEPAGRCHRPEPEQKYSSIFPAHQRRRPPVW
ncbi:MAG: hypothetical protein OP8BY_0945 [Candidatus Saccharicenans subterraneus]|uniref:Uncharacterized protein n=1 Tax=Candidatus Saccharicenans subterraneus TaxID=2508984 RepID=A0A3E2BQF3_9BACT|nr:MAG: hypothetical protein OP8BY_0945 [Candidatus Saccharicenans subterraneum]